MFLCTLIIHAVSSAFSAQACEVHAYPRLSRWLDEDQASQGLQAVDQSASLSDAAGSVDSDWSEMFGRWDYLEPLPLLEVGVSSSVPSDRLFLP